MMRSAGPEQWGAPWSSGPWQWDRAESGPPRGARWFPVALSLLVQLVVIVVLLVRDGTGGVPASAPLLAAALLAAPLLGSVLLLGLRSWPGPSVVAVALCTFPVIFLSSVPVPIAIPLAFAAIGATVRGARAWVWSTVGAGLLLTALLAFTVAERPSDIVRPLVVMLVLSVLVGLGEAARNRRDRFAEYRAAAVRRRQSEAEKERVRIARELHDVLAHSLSSINVQASVGLHLIEEQPEKAAEALANIKATSKSALEEVRGVLGFLRSSVDGADEAAPRMPQPELARLPALVESVSALGVDVTLSGQPPLGLAQLAELTIYRVVQEALTNITRHSSAKHATVAFSDDGGDTVVTVTDDGAHPPGTELVEGRGLLGMQERAVLLGGTLESGWLPDGGFRVALRLPRGGELS